MSELKSCMPGFEEVRSQYVMKMIQVRMSDLKCHGHKETFVEYSTGNDTNRKPLYATVYEVTDPRLVGFPPAKVWQQDGEIYMLFYATEGAIHAGRPFGDSSVFIFAFSVDYDQVVEYDVGMKVLIQQIPFGPKTTYVFSFASSEYENVINDPQEKEDTDVL